MARCFLDPETRPSACANGWKLESHIRIGSDNQYFSDLHRTGHRNKEPPYPRNGRTPHMTLARTSLLVVVPRKRFDHKDRAPLAPSKQVPWPRMRKRPIGD